jgi:hypothetical protein
MRLDEERRRDIGDDWAADVDREEAPVCARCGKRSEWRDTETGELLCDGCAR